jgi:hypothetical protein
LHRRSERSKSRTGTENKVSCTGRTVARAAVGRFSRHATKDARARVGRHRLVSRFTRRAVTCISSTVSVLPSR